MRGIGGYSTEHLRVFPETVSLRSVYNLLWLSQPFFHMEHFHIPLRNVYICNSFRVDVHMYTRMCISKCVRFNIKSYDQILWSEVTEDIVPIFTQLWPTVVKIDLYILCYTHIYIIPHAHTQSVSSLAGTCVLTSPYCHNVTSVLHFSAFHSCMLHELFRLEFVYCACALSKVCRGLNAYMCT